MNGHNGTTTSTTASTTNDSHSTTSHSSDEKGDITTKGHTTRTKENESMYEILQRWYKLLFTKEDYFHHHKILGILCLLSFLSRFMLQFYYDDMGFQAFPYLTIPTMILHSLLSLSSFQFKIPIRRIQDGGRIWPQYRYHSFIFTMRSILLMSVQYYEDYIHHPSKDQDNHLEQQERFYYMNYVVIMCVMGAVEYVNYMVGEGQRSNTIRELDGNPYTKFLFSTLQFNSIAVFLIGMRYYSIPFYALFTIQITPFIGTLRRKLIFTSNFWGAVVYAALLGGGFGIQCYYYQLTGGEVLHLFGRSIGLYAALIRFTDVIPKPLSILQNKFVIWTVMYTIVHQARSINYEIDVVQLRIILAIVILLMAITAYRKVQSGYYPKDVKHAKLMKMSDQKSA